MICTTGILVSLFVLCPAEVLRCQTLIQRLLKQWGLPFGCPEGHRALSDHWPGDLILEPYYQRRFSGDLGLRLSFYLVRFPFAHRAITDRWVYFRFWVALAWMWVWDGLLAFVILFVVSGVGFKLSNSNSASDLGGRILPWSIRGLIRQYNH